MVGGEAEIAGLQGAGVAVVVRGAQGSGDGEGGGGLRGCPDGQERSRQKQEEKSGVGAIAHKGDGSRPRRILA